MNRKEIGKMLVELRAKKNVSQTTAAKGIGIPQSTLAMYETGQRIPRDENKIKIANYYKKNVNVFFMPEKVTKCE